MGAGLLPLRGRAALVTGASRRAGIGHAIARRLAALGASLFVHHYTPHDQTHPWGADTGGPRAVIDSVTDALAGTAVLHHDELDLADPGAPHQLIATAARALGHLDILACNHACSGNDGSLDTLNADMLDAHGPVDTGCAPPEVHEALRHRFPQARWGVPDDPARLIAWLTTDDAAWVTGQTINTEGGFRRWN